MRRVVIALLTCLLAAAGTTAATPAGASAAPQTNLNPVGIDLCAQVAWNAGFRNNPLVTAIAVAMAESSCNPNAQGWNGPDGYYCYNGSWDRGLWQINDCWHPEVSNTCAYQSQCNANAAYTISSGGSSWSQWSTYNAGLHNQYISAAQQAVARLGGTNPPPTGVTGTILANPSLTIRSGPGTGYGYVGSAAYNSTVTITCYTFGEYVGGGYWPSSTWDRITTSTGVTGYAADTWINTQYDVKTMVGAC
jgi:hypothetical protein